MQYLNENIAVRQNYEYCPRGKRWAVYRCTTYSQGSGSSLQLSSSGEKIAEFRTKEEARREVYRLNGWHYNEKRK